MILSGIFQARQIKEIYTLSVAGKNMKKMFT
jgi:hypothetical protein